MKYSAQKPREFGDTGSPSMRDIATNYTQHVTIGRVPIETFPQNGKGQNDATMNQELDLILVEAFAALAFVTMIWLLIASVVLMNV